MDLRRWIFGLIGLVALGAPASGQEFTLRVHHAAAAQASVSTNFIRPWTEKVTRESEGRLRFEITPESPRGGIPASLIDKLREGRFDIAWVRLGATPGRFPEAEVFEIPFLAAGAEATSRAFQEFSTAHLKEAFADFHVIAVHVHGRGVVHNRTREITKLEDVAGLKIHAPTRMSGRLLAAAGATPVGMPTKALPEALTRKIVDGAVLPWEPTVLLRLSDLTKSHTDFSGAQSLYTATFAFLMNKKSYAALPDALRAVIDANSGLEAAGWAGRVMDEGDAPGLMRARAAGNPILTLDEEETGRWRVRAKAVEQAWIVEMKGSGLDAEKLVSEARTLIAKHQAN